MKTLLHSVVVASLESLLSIVITLFCYCGTQRQTPREINEVKEI